MTVNTTPAPPAPLGMAEHGWPSATELADQIRTGRLASVAVTRRYLDRIEAINPELNAFCRVEAAAALQAAAEVDEAVARGDELPPFAGVPIAIKDLHPVRGWELCSASNAVGNVVMDDDAVAVRALRNAGFVFVGATTSPEFGTVSVTESARHGVTRSPWDVKRSPGGSSGGTAAAVASGMLPLGHGSDGAGSIREPASFCGLVGMKPSRGLVPGDAMFMEGFATEGVLTRTVEDTAALLDVFAAEPGVGWYRHPAQPVPYRQRAAEDPGRLRIAFSTRPAFPTWVDPAAVARGRQAAELVAALGHDVVERDIPGLDQDWFQAHFDIIYATGSAEVEIEDESAVEPLNRTLREAGRRTDSIDYVRAVIELQLAARQMYTLWDDVDILLTPTNPVLAPGEGALWQGQGADPWLPLRRAEETAALTVIANVLGLPAISIPLVEARDGMPLGTQLIGGRNDDGTVLALAGQLERAYPWRHRYPAGVTL
ncbi:amidase [Kribbella solani]|uniref:Amidase n=1 Tax=Kribbella solani TaxID=236067 RepID=A0A841DX43_9ACTN|nr:amidase [Kribbella solani]MBB5983724.1 amidase [Kribbella solani]